MNQEVTFEHLNSFLEKSMQQYGKTKKSAFLHAISVLKVNQDLNQGSINMNERLNVEALASVIMMAAEGVGATREEVASQLKGIVAALNDDFEAFVNSRRGEKVEESVLPSPEVTEYLTRLVGNSKH